MSRRVPFVLVISVLSVCLALWGCGGNKKPGGESTGTSAATPPPVTDTASTAATSTPGEIKLDYAALGRRLPELAGLILASPAFQAH